MRLLLGLVVLWPRLHGSVLTQLCWGNIDREACEMLRLRASTEVYTSARSFLTLDRDTGLVQILVDEARLRPGSSAYSSMNVPAAARWQVYSANDNWVLWDPVTASLQCIDWTQGGVDNFRCWNFHWKGATHLYTIHETAYDNPWDGPAVILAFDFRTGQHMVLGDYYSPGRYAEQCRRLNLMGTTEIHTTRSAILAFNRNTGKVQCCGNPRTGGGCSGSVARDAVMYSSSAGFLAWSHKTGAAHYWGETGVRELVADAILNLSGFTDVSVNAFAFVAWSRTTGKALCFGAHKLGGNCHALNLTGTTDIYGGPTTYGFVALNRDTGEVQSWGGFYTASFGKRFPGVTTFRGTYNAFAAVYEDTGRLECWGFATEGGNCSGMNFSGVAKVYSTAHALMAVIRPVPSPVAIDPEPTSLWLPSLWLLGGGGLILVIATAIWWRHSADGKARDWNPAHPLPPHVMRKVSKMQCTCDSLESRTTSSENFQGLAAQCFPARVIGRAHARVDRLLVQAALRAGGGPQNWGMSVGQLLEFYNEHQDTLERYCQSHHLAEDFSHVCTCQPCLHGHGDAKQRPLMPHESAELMQPLPCNMHLVVDLLIKPMTKDHEGIMGFWASQNLHQPRKVETFVSHCWNERFSDLLATLWTLRHDTTVWVCSFALPQNIDVGGVIGLDVHRSPFALALAEAERVLLAVDDTLESLTRSWCCMELYLTVVKDKRLDIRAPVTSTSFYETIRDKIASMDICNCTASNPSDHAAIMEAIRGGEDIVNQKVRQHVDDTLQFLMSVVV